MTEETKSLGRIAYEAFHIPFGTMKASWDEVEHKDAHEKSAQAVRDAVLAELPEWVRVPDKLPECDKNEGENRLCVWVNLKDQSHPVGACWMDELHRLSATHYFFIPPLPVETGSADAFQKWWHSQDPEKQVPGIQSVSKITAEAIWNTAIDSTKP